MTFSRFSETSVGRLIERFSQSEQMTLIVGAGVSRESELPGWDTLIRRLLARVYVKTHNSPPPGAAELWVEETCKTHGVVAAAEIVEAFASTQLADWVDRALYEPDKKAAGALFQGKPGKGRAPGPIADQIAGLRRQYRTRVQVVTTNYDKLIETALRNNGFTSVHARVSDAPSPTGFVVVNHLHGYLHNIEGRDKLVLTESHYLKLQTADETPWQESLMKTALRESDCLFIGASLTDPNLIRYLHGNGSLPKPSRKPIVVLVRQGEHAGHFGQPSRACPLQGFEVGGDESIQLASDLEEAYVARWKSCQVQPVFLDHYGDVAQLLSEVSLSRLHGSDYVHLAKRMADWVAAADDKLVGLSSEMDFRESQKTLNEWLNGLLSLALETIEMKRADLKEEAVELALWLADADGRHLRNVGNSDRLQTNPATLTKAPLVTKTPWVASPWISVSAYCRGKIEYGAPDTYSSPWQFVYGIPLTPEDADAPSIGRLPVGCLTLASTSSPRQSFLRRLPEKQRIDFLALLQMGGEDFLLGAVPN